MLSSPLVAADVPRPPAVAFALPWWALPEVVRIRASRPRASCPSTASLMSVDRYLAQPLDEAPAVVLEVQRLVGAVVRAMGVRRTRDLCTCGECALVVRIDVVDVHADVVARGTGRLRAERAVGALRADPDHAVAELDHRVADDAGRAHAPRSRDLAEPERALQERDCGGDVLIRKLGNDRRSALGPDLLPDRCHERLLSPVERRRLEGGVSPQLPHQVHRLHLGFILFFPPGSSSSRSCARARLSRERTVPIGSSSASATLWYERSSHAKSRSASRSPAASTSIAAATRGKSRRASSAGLRLFGVSSSAAIRALARSRRASPRRCFSNKFARSGTATARRSRATYRTSCAARTRS